MTSVRFLTNIDSVVILICVIGKGLATLLTCVCLLFGINSLMPREARTSVEALSTFLIAVSSFLFILIAYIMFLLYLIVKSGKNKFK